MIITYKNSAGCFLHVLQLHNHLIKTSNNLITEYTYSIIPKSSPHKLPIKKFFLNLLNCRNLGEKGQIISYLENKTECYHRIW